MKLFDLSLNLNGFPIKKAQLTLNEVIKKNDNDFKSYVDLKKQEIVRYHLEHNPFYKSLSKDIHPEQWDSVPIMTKRHLQVPLEKRLSVGFSTKTVYVNKTSGSSSDPFIFAKNKFCHALTWATIQNRFNWFGLDFNSSKQARFYGIPLDLKGYYKERLKDSLSKRYRFSVFDLSDDAFENHLKKFKNTRFD